MNLSLALSVKDSDIAIESEPHSSHSSCAFPGICVLPSGRWLVSCRAAPEKLPTRGQHVLLSHSDDEGATWSVPFAPFSPLEVNNKPGLFRSASLTALGGDEIIAVLCWVDHSDADADFFNEETQGLLDTRIFLSRSRDGGISWSTPRLIDTTPYNVPTPLTGPILLLPNGEWMLQFELNKPYYDESEWQHSSIVMLSRDQGITWPEHAVSSHDPANKIFYWDQRPGNAPDGKMLDLFWTYDNAEAKYLNIHARESLDNGRTWSEIWDTGVPGQPAPPQFLKDGRIAMVYVDIEAQPMIKMRLSEYGVKSCPSQSEVTLFYL